MTAHSSVIQNFESGYNVDTCLSLLNNSEFWLHMPFILMIWNYSSQESHLLTWYAWYEDTKETSPSYGDLQGFLLYQVSLYWLQLWSPPEVNGNFAMGLSQQNTKKTLEMPYSDIVCPPSGLWSIGGSFFRNSGGLFGIAGVKSSFVLSL